MSKPRRAATAQQESVWSLPGQAATSTGPADMSVMYVVHHAIRRDLGDFQAAVAHTPLADRPTWRRLESRWRKFIDAFADHAGREDNVLWPLVSERLRTDDAAGAAVLQEIQADHRLIDGLIEPCSVSFDRLARSAHRGTHRKLVAALDRLAGAIHRHLAHEETEAVALLQDHIGDEWSGLENILFRDLPLRSHASFLVPWALKRLPRPAAARVREQSGLGFNAIFLITRRKFEAEEFATFRYARRLREHTPGIQESSVS